MAGSEFVEVSCSDGANVSCSANSQDEMELPISERECCTCSKICSTMFGNWRCSEATIETGI